MKEKDLIEMARQQISGGHEPQTPYERGAVQHFVAFGRRVLKAEQETWTSALDDVAIVKQSQLDRLEVDLNRLLSDIKAASVHVDIVLTMNTRLLRFAEGVCDEYVRGRADFYADWRKIVYDLAREAGDLLERPRGWWEK